VKCALCGEYVDRQLYCRDCTQTVDRWWQWAGQQQRITGRWHKVAIIFTGAGPGIAIDRSGGQPDPNAFVDEPRRALTDSDTVHIAVPQRDMKRSANAELAFYLRLKATPGCTSQLDVVGDVMHLYIVPNSEAAHLFVQRMLAKHRGLPAGEAGDQLKKLTPGSTRLLGEPK
jgi:hypothetical protein